MITALAAETAATGPAGRLRDGQEVCGVYRPQQSTHLRVVDALCNGHAIALTFIADTIREL
jgi:hypothetical protein